MNTKIQELTDKIYQEGVLKANVDAEDIIKKAKEQEQELIKEAEKKAQQIIENAEKEALFIKNNTEAELKMAASQMKEALKTSITDLVRNQVLKEATEGVFEEKDFVQNMILSLVKEWSKQEQLLIQSDTSLKLTSFFESKSKYLLDKGLSIEEVEGLPVKFQIISKEKNYKLEFGEEQFKALFKKYLRPVLYDKLFKE